MIPLGHLIAALDPNRSQRLPGMCPGPHCRHANVAAEPHTCPFQEEINDDRETLCGCCAECQQECADDI